MTEGVTSSLLVETDNSSELSSTDHSSTECSEDKVTSISSLLPRMEVLPYLFEPKRSFHEPSKMSSYSEIVETDDISVPDRVGNTDWCINKYSVTM